MNRTYTVSISFEEIKLPPFQDILVLGKNSAQGAIGLSRSIELVAPDIFEAIAIGRGNIETVFVSRKILEKISEANVLQILESEIFPYVSEGELICVDFKVSFSVKNIVVKSSEP